MVPMNKTVKEEPALFLSSKKIKVLIYNKKLFRKTHLTSAVFPCVSKYKKILNIEQV